MIFKKPTGTMDFYPEDMEIRNQIFDSFRCTAKKYGYKEVEAPAIESLELLKKKAGEDIKKQLFNLEKKGDESYSLRAELTPSITRMFIEKQKELSKPVKWFCLSRMWRYERPQAGRLREFYQLSAELFGSDKPQADAEIINLSISCLTDLGLTDRDFYVRINNRKLLQGILEEFADRKQIKNLINLVDKKDKITGQEFDKELKNFKIKDPKKLKQILETTDINKLAVSNKLAKKGLKELKQVIELLNKKFIKFDLATARGLAYYTGTIFELFDKSKKYRSLAGGGRYDNLVELFGGEACPATGFAIGYSTLSLLLKEKRLIPKAELGTDYYIAPITEKVRKQALKIADRLRTKYSVEIDIMQRKLSRQLDYANTTKAKKVIIIGERDLAENKVTLRDMITGKEKKLNIKNI